MSPISLREENGQADDQSRYHASSSEVAISAEAKYAAHNYHPLPIVFSRASGASVWDPVSLPLFHQFMQLKADLAIGRKTLS
jgi:hypothetical protein